MEDEERSIGHDRLLTYFIEELSPEEITDLIHDIFEKQNELNDLLAIALREQQRRTNRSLNSSD